MLSYSTFSSCFLLLSHLTFSPYLVPLLSFHFLTLLSLSAFSLYFQLLSKFSLLLLSLFSFSTLSSLSFDFLTFSLSSLSLHSSLHSFRLSHFVCLSVFTLLFSIFSFHFLLYFNSTFLFHVFFYTFSVHIFSKFRTSLCLWTLCLKFLSISHLHSLCTLSLLSHSTFLHYFLSPLFTVIIYLPTTLFTLTYLKLIKFLLAKQVFFFLFSNIF